MIFNSFHLSQKNISISTNAKCDDNITSVSTTTDDISHINTDQSTLVSWRLFPQSKSIMNEHNSNLTLTKQNLSHQIHRSTSDYIDWTTHHSNPSSVETTINNQLDAINFLQEYLQNGNSDVLIDLLHEIAHEINNDHKKKHSSYSAINNNHLHLKPTFNSNLQLSNNKEKKTKKEKSSDKGKKDSNENKSKKDEEKKENGGDEITSKKPKNKKEKSKKIEETTTTTTTDSEVFVTSPATRLNLNIPKSPAETTEFPTLSIPVLHSGGSSTSGFISLDPSRMHIPQQSNIAHLSQVQHQLQTDPQNPSLNKTTYPLNMSVQQQLQSLSQMARDGDEILITLNVNTLTQKQQMNTNNNIQNYQPAFPNNPYSNQPWNQMMPRNVEIVAKGFARVQNEHPQPPVSNTYAQQPIMHPYSQPPYTMMHPPFASRYPIPCHLNSSLPQAPIGPPIQPVFAPSMMLSRPPNAFDFTPGRQGNFDDFRNRSHINIGKCDHLCQSSIYQPDFRGRPSPGLMINPYFNTPSPVNFSAKRSSKHRHKLSSTKNKSHHQHDIFSENINRTYSSIY